MVGEKDSVESERFLTSARRFVPNAVSFRQYIADLNSHLVEPIGKISLASPPGEEKDLALSIDRLCVAWPGEKLFPKELVDGLKVGRSGAFSLDQVLEDVVITTVRQCSSPLDVRKKNILCNGFALGSEIGTASVFRNIDIRSPSTQMQVLRSPAWKRVFQLVGHVLFRHLMMNNILLLGIAGDTSGKARRQENIHEASHEPLALLQLCGPLPCYSKVNGLNPPVRSLSNITLKRDLLYQPAMLKCKTVLGPARNGRLHDEACDEREAYNDGLPKFHHLQGLFDDASSARRLMSTIFFQHNSCSSRLTRQGNPEASTDAVHPKNRNNLHHLEFSLPPKRCGTRGQRWLRGRRAGFKRLLGVVPVLRGVIKRTHAFSFRRVLGRWCPLSKDFYAMTKRNNGLSCETLMQFGSRSKDVAKFLVACTRQMLPDDAFGSLNNSLVFEKSVHTFLRRRYQRESFDIWKFCSQSGFRISEVIWLHRQSNRGEKVLNPTDLQYRLERLQEFVVWLFRGVLLPIMHQNFYVTEADSHRNRLFFFRREVWEKLVDTAYTSLLKVEKQMSIMSKEQLSEFLSRRSGALSALGGHLCPYPVLLYHQLRFVPKKASLRGIQKPRIRMLHGFSGLSTIPENIRIRRDSRVKRTDDLAKATGCMKKLFRHILKVLTVESKASHTALGASVFSLDDIYAKLLPLKTKWRHLGCPLLYACSVDISTSFDTIPLKILFKNVIPPLLRRERYACVRYMRSIPDVTKGTVTQRALIHVCSEPGEEASFQRVIRRELCERNPGSIFTDMVQATTLTREEIITVLQEFLSHNVVVIPRRVRNRCDAGFAVQSRGLPQGHTLSSLLTSLFYAFVENRDLSEFETAVSVSSRDRSVFQVGELAEVPSTSFSTATLALLMRQVDDTIFISTSREKTASFMKRMVKGWETSYGFRVNTGKTKCNFLSDYVKECTSTLSWCGLLIKTDTLEVEADYSRYSNNGDGRLRDSVFIVHDRQPGKSFISRASTCFKPKLHPILLDGHINSRYTVAANIYRAALLASLKLCTYAIAILPTNKNLASAVRSLMSNFIVLVHHTSSCRIATTSLSKFPLSKPEVKYLTVHALHSAISKRLCNRRHMNARVKPSLRMLEAELKQMSSCPQAYSQRFSTFELVAKRIADRSCHSLWALRL